MERPRKPSTRQFGDDRRLPAAVAAASMPPALCLIDTSVAAARWRPGMNVDRLVLGLRPRL